MRLLRSEGRQDLETFARSGLDEVDYGRFQEEVRGACGELDPAAGCAPYQGWILGIPQLHFPTDEKPRGADQPSRLGEEP